MKISKLNANSYFEKNLGQMPSNIKYKVNTNGYTTFLTEDKLIVSLPSNIEYTRNVFYMKIENTNSDINIKAQDKESGKVNYLIGNDESKWITDIPTYARIKYENIYENIDLYYYINNNDLEYDFVLSQGSNIKDISIGFGGLDSIELDENNNVVLSIGDTKALLLKPQVYQTIDNVKVYIDCEYMLDNNSIKFVVEEYEKEYELVLDPILKLDYSTYIGTNEDYSHSIAVDNLGYAYIAGGTFGGYPTTTGAYQTVFGGNMDAFVTKINLDGSKLVYSTYIGGKDFEQAYAIDLDSLGYAYITGYTQSSDYPITPGAYTTNATSSDSFITKLSIDGSKLVYSARIGGSNVDKANAVVVDTLGYAYISGTTSSNDYPRVGAYQNQYNGGNSDGFVTKLSIDATTLVYSTYIGGSGDEYVGGIALDSDNNLYIAGGTTSTNYPTTKGAYQITSKGDFEAYVTKLSSDGKNLLYSTYIGGIGSDRAFGIAVDIQGCAYITGRTDSIDYPTTTLGYQPKKSGAGDIFVTKLSQAGTNLRYSTYIGGSSEEFAAGIAVDSLGYAYIVGRTQSTNYPNTDESYQNSLAGQFNNVVSKLSIDGHSLVYSTYIGGSGADTPVGIALDTKGSAYITGSTSSTNYPTTSNAYKTTMTGRLNAFTSKTVPIEVDLAWSYKKNNTKLLDIIDINIKAFNNSSINLDLSLKIHPLNTQVSFISDSLCIQGLNQSTSTIPPQIYISNIPSMQSAQISFQVRYINADTQSQIPITLDLDMYDKRTGTAVLLDSITKTLYINKKVGPNYIPSCNKFYNLAIDNKLQTTSSGIPIVYYKTGNTYFYIEPSGTNYVYKVLKNLSNVTEYLIEG